jgi:phenylacetate-CoA ligase
MAVQAEALLSGLRSEGIRVFAIRTNNTGSGIAGKLETVRIVRTLVRLLTFLARLVWSLPRIEILHVNACSGLSFFLFAAPSILLGRLFSRKVILHYHGGAAREFLQKTALISLWLIRRATAVVVPSEYLLQVFEAWGIRAEVVPNICDLRRFRGRTRPANPVFVVARSLEPVYSIETALRAFTIVRQRHDNAELVIAGDGSQARHLRQIAGDLGISECVHFLGFVENSRIPAVLSNASAFLNTSLVDNQPVSIIEAFAAGIPVISSNVGGVPNLVTHGVSGLLFEPGDVDRLSEHMLFIAECPDRADTLAIRAKAITQQFSWPAVFQRLRGVYGVRAAA